LKRPQKARPVLKFRQIASYEHPTALPPDHAIPVALGDEAGDDWLSSMTRNAARVAEDQDTILDSRNHLNFIDLESATLIDVLSDAPRDIGPNQGLAAVVKHTERVIRKALEVDWED
jgi:hypothetical protein